MFLNLGAYLFAATAVTLLLFYAPLYTTCADLKGGGGCYESVDCSTGMEWWEWWNDL